MGLGMFLNEAADSGEMKVDESWRFGIPSSSVGSSSDASL